MPVKLRIILKPDDTRKLLLPDGIPKTMEQLTDEVRKINAEFLRITTVPLQTRFLASLDNHHIKLIELFRRKGGVIREKTQKILKVLDLSLEVNMKRECLLKCLILYFGEDLDQLIKEYL
ncbi:hypothetical protein cypCar_00042578, partial [Cyprinus carpio]